MPIDGPCPPPPPRLRLVGGSRRIAEGDFEAVMDFYGNLFTAMKQLVKHTGPVTRYVGFRRSLGGADCLHILGIEVEEIVGIPEGMTAWDLDVDSWTSWEGRNGRDVRTAEGRLQWDWAESRTNRPGRTVGEFRAEGIGRQDGGAADDPPEFWIGANAYVRPGEPETDADDVRIAEYDPRWPGLFHEMVEGILGRLGPGMARRIEHFGSTAVPGMPAKPVIDILVEVPSFREARRRVVPLSNNEEWEYWWDADHMVFVRRDPATRRRTHHVHMAPAGHAVWQSLAFRDRLRTDAGDAARYAALKRELAATHAADRERYTQAKAAFVEEVTQKARRP